jgi:hypothetical protein
MDVTPVCNVCQSLFNLNTLTLGPAAYYDSLPMCIIDAVFSIGVRYTSTQNVVKNYCTYYGLREFNPECDSQGDTHTVSQFIDHISASGIEKSADEIFKNHQRTSTRGGILKADAALRFAKVLQNHGIETLADFSQKGLSEETEAELRKIPGQKSGLSTRYFFMLAGDESQSKPDRHVLRFLKEHTGRNYSIEQAQQMLTETVLSLRVEYPNVTVRLLDHAIWDYMAHRK